MPYADFCSAVRPPLSRLSRRSDTEQISWGKLSHLPCTIAESTLRTLMDMDFAVSRPLVRHSRLLFGFCPSTRTFALCFLQTPPRSGSPCIIASPYLHQVGQRTFTSKLLSMPSTRLKLQSAAFSVLVQPEPTTAYRFAGNCQVPANTYKSDQSPAEIAGREIMFQ